jgi:hypothetical protein
VYTCQLSYVALLLNSIHEMITSEGPTHSTVFPELIELNFVTRVCYVDVPFLSLEFNYAGIALDLNIRTL